MKARLTETQIAGVSEQTPLGVEHFLVYLRAREMHEEQTLFSMKHPELRTSMKQEEQNGFGRWKSSTVI